MTDQRIEIRGPRGEEVYIAPSRAEPGWMVVVVTKTIVAMCDIVDDFRLFYRVSFTEPVATADQRWAACGRISTKGELR